MKIKTDNGFYLFVNLSHINQLQERVDIIVYDYTSSMSPLLFTVPYHGLWRYTPLDKFM